MSPWNKHGANQHTAGGLDRGQVQGGNESHYRMARLARDYPDMWERMKAGEFKNVAEAERAAGIFKPRLRQWGYFPT